VDLPNFFANILPSGLPSGLYCFPGVFFLWMTFANIYPMLSSIILSLLICIWVSSLAVLFPQSPISLAVQLNHIEIVKLLLALGAETEGTVSSLGTSFELRELIVNLDNETNTHTHLAFGWKLFHCGFH
jgi:hypothetical protein